MTQKAFGATANGAAIVTASSARKAAEQFFERFPDRHKCTVTEGVEDGLFFTITYGRSSTGEYPQSYKDVTKKTLATLPDVDYPVTP